MTTPPTSFSVSELPEDAKLLPSDGADRAYYAPSQQDQQQESDEAALIVSPEDLELRAPRCKQIRQFDSVRIKERISRCELINHVWHCYIADEWFNEVVTCVNNCDGEVSIFKCVAAGPPGGSAHATPYPDPATYSWNSRCWVPCAENTCRACEARD